MPVYEYHCPSNGRVVEVAHSMAHSVETWKDLCLLLQEDMGDTEGQAPVERLISTTIVRTPLANSKLREKGFSKLVRRDKGVYENVTANQGEPRLLKMNSNE